MNKLDKIIFINKVFAISDTGRIQYGQGEELTLEEWNAANHDVDAFPELSSCLELAQAAVLYAELKLTKQEADDLNEYGRLLARALDDDSDELEEQIEHFWDDKETRVALSDGGYGDFLIAREGDSYWDRIEYFF